jgi:hypothetical protein
MPVKGRSMAIAASRSEVGYWVRPTRTPRSACGTLPVDVTPVSSGASLRLAGGQARVAGSQRERVAFREFMFTGLDR